MTVVATYGTNRPYLSYFDTPIQPAACYSSAAAVGAVATAATGCSVVFAPNGASESFGVIASYSGFNVSLSYRVYSLMSYSVQATRTNLRRLGCDFETSYLGALGVITLDGVTPIVSVDISNMVTFSSSDSSVLGISGRIASGASIGSAVVSFAGGQATCIFTVSASVASVMQLVSFAYNSMYLASTTISASEFFTAALQVQPLLTLTAELQTAYVVTYALDDDGAWTDVSRNAALTLVSLNPRDLNVNFLSGNWQLVVPIGASPVRASSTPVISSSLADSCGAFLYTSGYGFVSTNLSLPISINIRSAESSLARPGSAAATLLGISSSSQLIVTITFRSPQGSLSEVDFTSDSRTHFNISFYNATGQLSSGALLSLNSNFGANSAGRVLIEVTIPTYSAAVGLDQSLWIPIVDVDNSVPLRGSLVHLMAPTVPVNTSTPLAQIACTGSACFFCNVYFYFVFTGKYVHLRQVSIRAVGYSFCNTHRWKSRSRRASSNIQRYLCRNCEWYHRDCTVARYFYNNSNVCNFYW